MKMTLVTAVLAATAVMALAAPKVKAQSRPYMGYVYPAGGQQGATFAVKIGGQSLDNVTGVIVTGGGVSAKVDRCFSRIGPQEITLLRDQLRELKAAQKAAKAPDPATDDLIARIEKRIGEYCQRPASAALSGLVFLEFTIAKDATPGKRELRLVTHQGMSNPLAFHVGQLPEMTRKPMLTAEFQVPYRYAFIQVNMGDEVYTFQPIDYVGEEPLTEGRYTYELTIIDRNLFIKLKTD